MHSLGVMLSSIVHLPEDENEPDVFSFGLLHSTTFICFLYHSPSSSCCSLIEDVSSNIDMALNHQPSLIISCM